MRYRRFGRTELKMPVLSCGGMRYQHSWSDVDPKEINHSNQDNLEAIIKRALELGINHIETARGYGTSELQLGRILPTLPRKQLIVQTKVSPSASPKKFRKTFEQSMRNLQLDYIDLFGIHGINTEQLKHYTLRKGGILDEVNRLRNEGLIRHVGFSTHAPLELIVELVESGEFEYVNLHWYYVDQINRQAIEAAHKKDMGVFIISPNDKGGKLYTPPEKLVDLCQPLHPMVFNDLFCLANPHVHTLSIGAANPADFDKHLQSVTLLDRANELLTPILNKLEKTLVDALGRDWVDHWDTGLPRWNKVPGETNLRQVLRLYNLCKAFDMVDFGKMRYNLLGNADHWFPGNRVDSLQWNKLASCLKDSPVAERIPDALREADQLMRDKPRQRLSESN